MGEWMHCFQHILTEHSPSSLHVSCEDLLLDARHVALLSLGPRKKLADLGP